MGNDTARAKYYERLDAKTDEFEQELKIFKPRQPQSHHRSHNNHAKSKFNISSWETTSVVVFSSNSCSSDYSIEQENEGIITTQHSSDTDFRPTNHDKIGKILSHKSRKSRKCHHHGHVHFSVHRDQFLTSFDTLGFDPRPRHRISPFARITKTSKIHLRTNN